MNTIPGPARVHVTAHPGGARRARTRLVAAVLLAASLGLAGCSTGGDSGESGSAKAYAPSAEGAGGGAAEKADRSAPADGDGKSAGGLRADQLTDREIIRTAELSVRVEDVPKALVMARSAVRAADGLIGDESTDRDDLGHEHSTIVMRVPQDRYDDLLKKLGDAGTLLSRDTKAEDVTEKVVDVESRLKNQRASVARIRELMDRATRISDVVTLEGELSSRQADLESLLAQRESLKNRTAMATVTLSLTEAPAEDGGDDGFPGAVADGWDAFLSMLRWLSVALGTALPFLALALALLLLWRWLARPLRARRATAAAPAPVRVPAPVGAPAAPTRAPETAQAPEQGGDH
ncbi:DUF4349 domain-containing protein [Streptomyces uncialis]|uniref:DUF4349 domain-containing protein n=1 Tax=Streptomyces uncialis TaxID=1048205 RepID=UPI0022529A86|nr:DUF4349 domain-containing protein [Streptomyces uncialis]MCX4659516.1 DUF4349 domain-containing protein [Streptomyces uncialis]WTE13716.1 DUF4349 domain-containing protein [Streptomyces uncialis]